MITVGGLLLGAVLTAPGAAGPQGALAEPFDPSLSRGAIARGDQALGLRDPFGAHPGARAMVTAYRGQPSPDLRDPFDAPVHRRPVAGPPQVPFQTDLRSPFAEPPGLPAARRRLRPSAQRSDDLRDPFGA